MNMLAICEEILALNLKENVLRKSVKRLNKSYIWLSVCVLGLSILAFDQEKRLQKLEKSQDEKLRKAFEQGEKSMENEDFDKEIDEEMD